MIRFDEIKSIFGDHLRSNPSHFEFMLKEYFHYRMLRLVQISVHQKERKKMATQGNRRTVHVYADWQRMNDPQLMGILFSERLKGKELFSFK